MMAKIFLPLLLIVSAVAGDDINYLCTQLTAQLNRLQNLVPLEIDVLFPRGSSQVFSGPAKYRVATDLILPLNSCTSTTVSGSSKRSVVIKLNNDRSFIISPTRIFTVYQPTYTLKLEVEELSDGKKVTVVDFATANSQIHENSSEIALALRVFINNNLQASLKEKLQRSLNATFGSERVVVSGNSVRDLMVNVFQVAAQDF